MSLYIKLSLFALFVLLVYSESRSVPEGRYQFGDSYIDDIKLSYENGVWQCDMITCPLGVYGCKIQRKNDPRNRLQLIRTNICYHRNDGIVRSVFNTEAVPATKTVDINITSFEGAQSVYATSYGLFPQTGESMQTVVGVIAAKDWTSAQESSRDTIKDVEAKLEGSATVVKKSITS